MSPLHAISLRDMCLKLNQIAIWEEGGLLLLCSMGVCAPSPRLEVVVMSAICLTRNVAGCMRQ